MNEPPTSAVPLPEQFILARYRFILEASDPLQLPSFKSSALRGGFGHTFKRLVCAGGCDKSCRRGNACPYGYIFETSPPEGAEVLRNFSEVPRPFIIQSPPDRRSRIAPGEKITFDVTLIGNGINYLPHYVMTFKELGRVGLGKDRGRYQLEAVDMVSPTQDTFVSVYRTGDDLLRVPTWGITSAMIVASAALLPSHQITLNFLTPTKLKQQGEWVQEAPPFAVLIRTLLSRISSLSYFHCGERFETDFRGVIDQAEQVRIKSSEVRWEDWERFSGRQKQRINMGGVVGRVTYEGDLTPYLPLLALGELVHVGKGTVFGNGQYQIVTQKGQP